ncbi:MAG: T9SS type A sorting domain-containing protein, partial [Acidobacteriota bacterium]
DLFGMDVEGTRQWKIAEDVVSWDWGPALTTAVNGNDGSLGQVKEFALLPNYPNPFNPSTTIRYMLPAAAYVTLKIFDVLGREIAAPVNAHQGAGSHTVTFDPQLYKHGSASGVYLYRLTAHAEGHGMFSATRKMVFVR